MPRRSVLIIGINANGEVRSSLPWVGTGGERCPGMPYVGRWTENGRELYTLAKDYGWKLQDTFGPRRAEQWTCYLCHASPHHLRSPSGLQWISWPSSTGHDGSYDGCSQKEEERSATTGVGPHETL